MKIIEQIEESRIFAILMILIIMPLLCIIEFLYFLLTGKKIVKEFGDDYDDW